MTPAHELARFLGSKVVKKKVLVWVRVYRTRARPAAGFYSFSDPPLHWVGPVSNATKFSTLHLDVDVEY
jgi:hypothetical protein